MKELSLREVQKRSFDILLYFDDVCKKYKIKYFLSNGTLLGAVKYGGFIPWDDDIDVFIPRADYNRLMCEFKDTEQYKLFSYDRNPEFRFPFAKLCDMTTEKRETGINNGVALGINIDIFPLDFFPSNINTANLQIKKTSKILYYLNFAKLEYTPGKNVIKTFGKIILFLILRCIGAKRMVRKIIKISNSDMKWTNTRYMGCAVWPIYGNREIIPKEVFDNIVYVRFEGERFPAPIGYDIYLRSLYGDYWEDPPLEKQKTHHKFKAYEINKKVNA